MRTLSLNIPLVHVQVGLARHLDEAEALVPRDHSAAQAGGLPPLLVCLSRLVSCRPARLGRGPSRLVCGAAHQHRAVIIARLVALPLRRQVVLVVVVVHALTDAAMSRVCGARVAGATSGLTFCTVYCTSSHHATESMSLGSTECLTLLAPHGPFSSATLQVQRESQLRWDSAAARKACRWLCRWQVAPFNRRCPIVLEEEEEEGRQQPYQQQLPNL